MPTPSVPRPTNLQPANLSQSDMAGRWSGAMIITGAVYPPDMKPEDKAQCEELMTVLKDTPIATDWEFQPSGPDGGTMVQISFQDGKEQRGEPGPYKYQNGMITADATSSDGTTHMEARTGRSGGKNAFDGTWSYKGALDLNLSGGSSATKTPAPIIQLSGTWYGVK